MQFVRRRVPRVSILIVACALLSLYGCGSEPAVSSVSILPQVTPEVASLDPTGEALLTAFRTEARRLQRARDGAFELMLQQEMTAAMEKVRIDAQSAQSSAQPSASHQVSLEWAAKIKRTDMEAQSKAATDLANYRLRAEERVVACE